MLKAETSRTSRTRAGVAITGFALPVVVGLSLTFVGPAAADVTNKQSSTAAQAQSAPSNVMSLRGSTTPPIGKSRSRPALVGSAAVRSGTAAGGAAGVTADRWSGPAPANLTEDRVPHNLTASRSSGPAPAGLTEDRVPHNLTASRWSGPAPAGLTEDRVPHSLTASRWSGPAPDVMARPTATANEGLLRPIEIAAVKAKATMGAAIAPSAARAPTSGATRAAMLTPASTMAADRSAATELLKSKVAVNALRKARHDAAAHQR
jgi:hypothetical protein